jgi:acyl transferase domain-containing protein/acyl carrier protein
MSEADLGGGDNRRLPEGNRRDLTVAAVNGPSATVVSGDPGLLGVLAERVVADGGRARMLPVDYASHGPQVDELREEILGLLAGVRPREARIPMVSALTGEYLAGTELNAQYWFDSLRAKVEFSRAVEVLARDGYGAFIESSPHPVLTAGVIDILENLGRDEPTVTGTLRRDDGDVSRLLASLAAVHVRGIAVDWASVLPAGEKVALPTYAFQRRRYWPEPVPGPRRERAAVDTSDWRYRITWTALPEPVPTGLVGTWLLVVPPGFGAVTQACTQALTQQGAEVRVLEARGQDDRSALAARLTKAAGEEPFAGVLSLLALDERPMAEFGSVPQGLSGTMILGQSLGEAGISAPLWVLTTEAVSPDGGAVTSPRQAETWAFGRVIGLEHPDRWGGLIDLPAQWDPATATRLTACLTAAVVDGGEDQVAIRAGGVFGRRLVRASRPEATGAQWTPGGTVLVTGGTGGVGGHVSRWLAERGAERIVLSSRSGPRAPGAVVMAAELAASGTRASVLAGDIGDRAQTAALLEWIAGSGSAVSSVMHAAGAGLAGPVDGMVPAELEGSLNAKAIGAMHLDELTSDLDAFVVFSSGAAAWGSGRLSGYAAANGALDVLVENRRARGEAGTSVAWGLWGGGGMGQGLAGEVLQRMGMREMDPRVAVGALAEVLDDGEGVLAIGDIDWDRFAPVFTAQRPSPLFALIAEAQQALGATEEETAPGSALAERLAGMDRAGQEEYLTDLVRTEAAMVLGHSSAGDVPPDRPFRDLGFDSLTAVDLRTRLNTATGLKLPATLVFDYPTPVALADFIRSRAVDEKSDYVLALAELKKLEAILARAGWNPGERLDLTSRLDALGGKVRGATPPADIDRELESATDDEMFGLVEAELRDVDLD